MGSRLFMSNKRILKLFCYRTSFQTESQNRNNIYVLSIFETLLWFMIYMESIINFYQHWNNFQSCYYSKSYK